MNSITINKILFSLTLFLASNLVFAQKGIINQADRLFENTNYVLAAKKYSKAVQNDENDFHALSRLGDCYRLLRKSKEAVDCYKKAVLLKDAEQNPIVYYHYAVVLKEIEEYKESDIWIEKYHLVNSSDIMVAKLMNNSNKIEELRLEAKKVEIYPVDVNSPQADWGPCYFQENQLIFTSSRDSSRMRKPGRYNWNNEPFLDLYAAERRPDGKLLNPRLLFGKVNSEVHEGPACFTADYKTMYFTRNNILSAENQGFDVNKLKIFTSTFNVDKQRWKHPKELPFNSINYSCAHPSVSDDGTKLYFASDMPGGFGKTDIYVVTFENGKWGKPVNLGENINTPEDDMFPFIHSSGTLYYATKGLQGFGGFDIFYAEPTSIGFAPARNLGLPFNTSLDDFSIIFDSERKTGYLSSNRNGKSDDIYYFKILIPKQ